MPGKVASPVIYCLHTLPGLEQIAWLEIRSRFSDAEFIANAYARNEHGATVFSSRAPLEDIMGLRTTERVLAAGLWLPKLSRNRHDLREVRESLSRGGEIGRLFNLSSRLKRKHLHTYQVIARKYGQHQYSMRDWSTAIRGAIAEAYPSWHGTTTNPDVEVWAVLYGSQGFIGVRLPGLVRPGALNPPALTAALVLLTEPDAKDTFLDPIGADGGAILSERLSVAPVAAIWGVRGSLARRLERPDPLIQQLRRQQNTLPLTSGSVQKMATILPTHEQALEQYPHILAEMTRLLHPQGIAALYCEEYDRVRQVLREMDGLQIAHGYSVQAGENWGRIYVLQHGMSG